MGIVQEQLEQKILFLCKVAQKELKHLLYSKTKNIFRRFTSL